jgi:hypothetical protein
MYAACLTAAIICVVFASMSYPSSASGYNINLMKLVTYSEDVRINAQDLAILIAAPGFDAVPEGGYVIVKLDKATYMMAPNGVKPGLADLS